MFNYMLIILCCLMFFIPSAVDNLFLHIIYIISLLIAWFRGLGYLKFYDGTAFIATLVVETLADARWFLAIFVYFIVGFVCITYYVQGDVKSQFNISDLVKSLEVLFLDFSDGSNFGESIFQQIIILFGVLVGFLLMLNIIVAIVLDTFHRVKFNWMLLRGK